MDLLVDMFQLLIRKHSEKTKAILQIDAWLSIYDISTSTAVHLLAGTPKLKCLLHLPMLFSLLRSSLFPKFWWYEN